MFRVIRYCVQPYVRRCGELAAEDVLQFRERSEALDAARVMQRRVAGAAVYEVSGWPVQNLWAPPRLIARYGEVGQPPISAAS
jgi:hypothetical protein